MSTSKLWNKIRDTSCQQRLKNKNFDGKSFWNKIKKILEKESIKADSFKALPKSLVNDVMTLPEYQILGNGDQEILEHNHFIIQTVRIPLTEKPTLKKIMQIALNIGQCKGMGSKYNKYLIKRTKIENYLSKKDIDNLDKNIHEKTIEEIYKYLLKF